MVWRHSKFNWFRSWSVFDSLSGPEIDLQKMPILAKKKFSFQMKLIVILAQNCRILATENSHEYIEKPSHQRVPVWCGFWSTHITGTFFCENEKGEAVTVNGDRYRAVLNEFLFTKIEEEDFGNIWFQQDGATCHTGEVTLYILSPVFEDRIISHRSGILSPPRSCDSLYYYLWGAIKDKYNADKSEKIDAIKDNIRKASCTQSIMCLKLDRSCRLLHDPPGQPSE